MKYALVDGMRQEARPGRTGECPACHRPVLARCGEVRTWHWAHAGRRLCDRWWENETGWHRDWKNEFPAEWQELVHHSQSGERHIADVKTAQGWVIEFQHSFLNPQERRSREAFYPKLVWVVDGLRRQRDKQQFQAVWNRATPLVAGVWLVRHHPGDCALFRDWSGGLAPVFLDFGESCDLWFALRERSDGALYIAKIARTTFIAHHRAPYAGTCEEFGALLEALTNFVVSDAARRRVQALARQRPMVPVRRPLPYVRTRRSENFHECAARRARSRRRF